MLPCYGIAPDRLTKLYGALQNLGVGPVASDPFTRSVLWLSGLNYAFSYFAAARSRPAVGGCVAPAHRLDDGLDETARAFSKSLVRAARSHTWDDATAFVRKQGIANEEWLRLQLAWISPDKISTRRVREWLTKNGTEEGWLRLCVAAGICSLWAPDTFRFVHAMMRKPFPSLIPDLDDDRNDQVAHLVKSFAFDRRTDTEER